MYWGQGRARHSVRAVPEFLHPGAHGVTRPTAFLILSGSLPRGVPLTAYANSFASRTVSVCGRCSIVAAH